MTFKIPKSVLVVIHTRDLEVLLLERTDRQEFWQSVTGSVDRLEEPLPETAAREVLEETGIVAGEHILTDWSHVIEYEIYPHYRHRYAPGVVRNTEHWFGLTLARRVPVALCAREHTRFLWLDYREAAKRCFSPSNSEAILALPSHLPSAAR